MKKNITFAFSLLSFLLTLGLGTALLVFEKKRNESDHALVALMEEGLFEISGRPDDGIPDSLREELNGLKAAIERNNNRQRTIDLESSVYSIRRNQIRFENRLSNRLNELELKITQKPDPTAILAEEYADFGDLSVESGNFNAASDHYKESLDYRQSNDVLYAYAESLYRSDPDVRDDREIVDSLKTILNQEPRREDALELLGVVSLENGDTAAALYAYAVLYELHPGDEPTASIYGRLLMHQKRFAEAIGPLAAAAASGDEDPSLSCDLGRCLAALGRHEEAVESFRDSIRLDAFYPPAHLGMAESLLTLGLGREAAQSAAVYCELRGNDYRGHLVEGDAYVLAGDRIKAEMAWNSALGALELNSRADVEKLIKASVRLADSLMERGRPRAALARSVSALEYEDVPELLRVAAWASEELGDADASRGYVKRLEKALADLPEGAGLSS